MSNFYPMAVLLGSLVMSACSPTFNWREVRLDASHLMALLPCKPDQGARVLALAGQEVELHMVGCEAGGAMFAVAYADLKSPDHVMAALTQWKAATLTNMQAQASSARPFVPKGATLLPQAERVLASGIRPDGSAVVAQAVWFASGTQVFHAAVYADKARPEVTETFFAGLKLL
jgi:hypothetical protein